MMKKKFSIGTIFGVILISSLSVSCLLFTSGAKEEMSNFATGSLVAHSVCFPHISLKKAKWMEMETFAPKASVSAGGLIDLELVSPEKHLSFNITFDSDEWNLLIEHIDSFYLSTARSHDFMGTAVGLL